MAPDYTKNSIVFAKLKFWFHLLYKNYNAWKTLISTKKVISFLKKLNIESGKKYKMIDSKYKSIVKKQMVQEYENNIIEPPLEFRDDYEKVVFVENVKYQTHPVYDMYATSKEGKIISIVRCVPLSEKFFALTHYDNILYKTPCNTPCTTPCCAKVCILIYYEKIPNYDIKEDVGNYKQLHKFMPDRCFRMLI